jgi:hypothetical protein
VSSLLIHSIVPGANTMTTTYLASGKSTKRKSDLKNNAFPRAIQGNPVWIPRPYTGIPILALIVRGKLEWLSLIVRSLPLCVVLNATDVMISRLIQCFSTFLVPRTRCINISYILIKQNTE